MNKEPSQEEVLQEIIDSQKETIKNLINVSKALGDLCTELVKYIKNIV